MTKDEIRQIIEGVVQKMGVAIEGVTLLEIEDKTAFVIKTQESNLLIGSRGAHIAALNHLVKRIAGKRIAPQGEPLDFYVDVNDYHDKLMNEIKNKAQILAGRARSFKTNIEMEPMPPYERMIVHTIFQDSPDIKTESMGDGPRRRVVLRYVGDDTAIV